MQTRIPRPRTAVMLSMVVSNMMLAGCNFTQDLARQLFVLNVTPTEMEIRPYESPELDCDWITPATSMTVTIRRGATVDESIRLWLEDVPAGVEHLFCENGLEVTTVRGASNQVHTVQLAFDATAEAPEGAAEITVWAELDGLVENDNRLEHMEITVTVLGLGSDGRE